MTTQTEVVHISELVIENMNPRQTCQPWDIFWLLILNKLIKGQYIFSYLLPHFMGYFFQLGIFYTHHPTVRTVPTTVFVTAVMEQ